MVPPTGNQDRAKLIAQLVEKFGSVARFQDTLAHQPGQELMQPIPPELYHRAQTQLMTDAWKNITDRFLNSSWKSLARDPKAFNSELDQLLERLREWMKLFYGLESRKPHRPTKNGKRDQEIHEKRLRGLSFGQIAYEFNLPAKVVERAFKRYDLTKKKELHGLLTFLFEAYDRASALDSIRRTSGVD